MVTMDKYSAFTDQPMAPSGEVSRRFLSLGISTFQAACRHVHELPYGYNSDRDDLMILFKEKMGTCTTKSIGPKATPTEKTDPSTSSCLPRRSLRLFQEKKSI
jgi:hypothetical protein